MDTNKIIDSLGGTSSVAEMCGLTTGAVSQWRTSEKGIPRAWLMFFKESKPEIFAQIENAERTPTKEAA